jgi:excisionase family DNA binding protein
MNPPVGKNGKLTTISVSQTAHRLGWSPRKVHMLIEEGVLRAYRDSERGWWRVDVTSVTEYEQRRQRMLSQEIAPP